MNPISELNNQDEILEVLQKYQPELSCVSTLRPMFHGTDYSLLDISDAEREKYYQMCQAIISPFGN